MAGTVAAGELSRSPVSPTELQSRHGQADRATRRFAIATRADDAAIRRLLCENPMRGAISVSFEREPDYFRGAAIADADDRTIVAFDRGRLVCMGRCTTRPCWLNGEIRRVGYLGELRLDAQARGRIDLLRGGYGFFRELQRDAPADFYFTSIAADNVRARRLLERGLPGLPRYEFLTELTTLLIPAGKKSGHDALESATPVEIADFLNACGQPAHLATAWTADRIASLARHDLPAESFGVVRDGGRIIACGAVWDQRGFRQTVIRDYSRALKWARPFINAFGAIVGTPRLPVRGTVVAHAFLSPFAIAATNESMRPDVIERFRADAAQRRIDYLTVAFPSDHPQIAGLRRHFRGRVYTSRLYRVSWPDDVPLALDSRPFMPEVAFL